MPQTSEERRAYKRNWQRANRKKNRENLLGKRRAYYQAHRDAERAKKREYQRQYRARHGDDRNARRRADYAAHSETYRQRQQAYTQANPEKIRAIALRTRTKNREERNAKRRAHHAAHPEERSVRDRARRAGNLAAIREKERTYRRTNPLVFRVRDQKRRARKYGAPLNDLSTAQWREIEAACDFRCVYCDKQLQRLTMDHLTPLSQGGSHTVQNILPACSRCNSRKRSGAVLCPVQPFLLTIAQPKKL